MTLDELPLVLKPAEAAQALRVSAWQIYQSAQRGELRTVRLGRCLRIPRSEIERLLGARPESHQGGAGPATGPATATDVTTTNVLQSAARQTSSSSCPPD